MQISKPDGNRTRTDKSDVQEPGDVIQILESVPTSVRHVTQN